VYVSWFSGSNTLSAPAGAVRVALTPPPGVVAPAFDPLQIQGGIYGYGGGTLLDMVAQPAAPRLMQFTKKDGSVIAAGPVGFVVNLVMEIQ
jgi:hypothetical protein